MKKFELNHFNSWFLPDRLFDAQVNLYIDRLVKPHTIGLNIAVLCEPESIIPKKDFFIKNGQNFDVILTYNSEILEKCPNSQMFEFGSCWIKDEFKDKNKKYEVSFLVGGKSKTDGHKLRHNIWIHQEKIKISKNFFISSHYPFSTNEKYQLLKNNKEPLFTSQFHICIENSKEINYFSEKLIDCLFTKTIPIYWGCPNIGDFFDLNSIIVVNSLDEIINTLNQIDENFYQSKIDSINKNYEKCKIFLDFNKRLNDKVEEIIKNY